MSDLLGKNTFDMVVIGAGHNGLVAASYLGKAGYRVLVVERRQVLGGATASEEIFPMYRANTGSSDASLLLPNVVAELSLRKHGLTFIDTPVLAYAPQTDDRALVLWREQEKTMAEIARFSSRDATNYTRFQVWAGKQAEILQKTMTLTPPILPQYQITNLLPWLSVGLKVRRRGMQAVNDLLRVLPMPIAEVLDEWFESPLLKGLLGSAGILGSMLGPRSPGTALMFLYYLNGAAAGHARGNRFVRGGMGQLAEALANAVRENGGEIRTGVGVRQILIEEHRAKGVLLENGEEIQARVILSNADPRQTFFDLVGATHLEVRFVRELKNIRYRGCTARVILALDDMPHFRAATGRSGDVKEGTLLSGRVVICPDLDYLERAYDNAKYGLISNQPYLEITMPTMLDASLAPPGKHLMEINVQYAPYHLREGDWDREVDRFGDRVIELLESYAPGLSNLILHRLVLSPLELERRFGLSEGCIYHGQMSLDQLLFMRPVPACGRYRTPIQSLYLCGAGTHPGGGVTGAPGHNAARAVLRDLSGRK